VSTVDPVKLRLGIGYVIQSGGLMPHQRVIDNVACVPVLNGQSRRAARRAAYEVLERVGLDPKLGERYPGQLSGGQQQRVGVARALAADPPILLMDEPFSAVDPVVRDELQAEMLRLQSELRKTIVFVTHDIDEAVKLGDAVAVFGSGGSLQQYDAPAQLLSNPANDFVSEFIGADRGYRALQFLTSSTLALRPVPTVTRSQQMRGAALLLKMELKLTQQPGFPPRLLTPAPARGSVMPVSRSLRSSQEPKSGMSPVPEPVFPWRQWIRQQRC
jgi:osmoprotectant transport system ATP-binding protein